MNPGTVSIAPNETAPAEPDPTEHARAPRQPLPFLQIPPGATLGGLFRAVARRTPERVALSCSGRHLTYAELLERAERVAAGLAGFGAVPGSIVAIHLERGFDMVAAMLGTALAGAAYLPLDIRYPQARLRQTLADAEPIVVISSTGHAPVLADCASALFLIDQLAPLDQPALPFTAATRPADPAYVLYTSGSTGEPKGVIVTQHNVIRLLHETARWFDFTAADVWTMFHSFAFDFSVWEMWGSLLSGARLVIVPFEVSRDPDQFRALLLAERVTVLNQTPSAFALLERSDEAAGDRLGDLRVIVFGGEALYPGLLAGWVARYGDQQPQLVNMYGITETTVHVTYRRISAQDVAEEHESVLGTAIADLHLLLLDEQGRPVAAGVAGELYVGGAGVAQGYLGRPELTAERFLPDGLGGRLYRTGDWARRRHDGQLVYLGRRDGQVKINGFRIELQEIETALGRIAGVAQGCCIVSQQPGSEPRLVGYWSGCAQHSVVAAGLRTSLPAHMVPSLLVPVTSFPLTLNGKIDRAALPSPERPETRNTASPGTEASVASAWCKALGLAAVDPDENFFDVGGSSLSLIAVRAELLKTLGRELPIAAFFEATTVRTLARRLELGGPQPHSAPGLRAASQRLAFSGARNLRRQS